MLAFSVLFYHLLYYVHGVLVYNIGLFSVYAFFVLSGYALHYVYAPRIKNNSEWLEEYLKARFFRVIPLLILVTIFWSISSGGGAWKIILNALGLFGLGSPGDFTIAGGAWSLGIEMVFYLLFPVLFVLLKIMPIRIGLVLFFSSISYINTVFSDVSEFSKAWGTYISPLSFIFYFFSGMALSRFRSRFLFFVKRQRLSLLFFIVVSVSVSIMPSLSQIDVLTKEKGVIMMFLVVFMVLFFSVIKIPSWLKCFSIYLGNISYGVYLWHSFILAGFMKYSGFQGVRLSISIFIMTIIVASMSYVLFEKPIRIYGRSFGMEK